MTKDSATIDWDTDMDADSEVLYGTDEDDLDEDEYDNDMDDKHKDEPGYVYASPNCLACHPDGRER